MQAMRQPAPVRCLVWPRAEAAPLAWLRSCSSATARRPRSLAARGAIGGETRPPDRSSAPSAARRWACRGRATAASNAAHAAGGMSEARSVHWLRPRQGAARSAVRAGYCRALRGNGPESAGCEAWLCRCHAEPLRAGPMQAMRQPAPVRCLVWPRAEAAPLAWLRSCSSATARRPRSLAEGGAIGGETRPPDPAVADCAARRWACRGQGLLLRPTPPTLRAACRKRCPSTGCARADRLRSTRFGRATVAP